MRCDILTLFPDMVAPVLGQSILKRAQEKGLLEVHVHNLRDYTLDKHKVADDVPYGGGAGMVMKAEPILRAVEQIRDGYAAAGEADPVAVPLSAGSPVHAGLCEKFWRPTHVDSSFSAATMKGSMNGCGWRLQPEEISVGDYVLTGGELPALILIDAAARLVPGVLGDPESIVEESFTDALLEYPHYTRPAEVRGMPVPEVLLSGHHEAIRLWRRKEALRSTYQRRPDLLQDRVLSLEDQQLLDEIIREGVPGMPVRCGEEG